ncbi:MAG: hypothetical protein U0350_36445 [Caldilineaceae bacterium]
MCYDIKSLLGIKDLADDLKKTKKEIVDALRIGDGATHKFTVQKPFCCPFGSLLEDTLTPYGVKIISVSRSRTVATSIADYAQRMRIEAKTLENLQYGPAAVMFLPLAVQCDLVVRKSQAEWAEYLIERSRRMCVVGGRINAKNRDWANQHNGQMPRPWVEKDCHEGNDIWSQVSNIQKEQESKGNAKRK